MGSSSTGCLASRLPAACPTHGVRALLACLQVNASYTLSFKGSSRLRGLNSTSLFVLELRPCRVNEALAATGEWLPTGESYAYAACTRACMLATQAGKRAGWGCCPACPALVVLLVVVAGRHPPTHRHLSRAARMQIHAGSPRPGSPAPARPAGDACLACSEGFFSLDGTAAACRACPAGASCNTAGMGGAMLTPLRGYWHSAPLSANVLACPNAKACAYDGRGALLAAVQAGLLSKGALQANSSEAGYRQLQCGEVCSLGAWSCPRAGAGKCQQVLLGPTHM